MSRTYAVRKKSVLSGDEPSHFYSVPCASCGAAAGQPCRRVSKTFATGLKEWTLPHKSRVVRRRQIEELQG